MEFFFERKIWLSKNEYVICNSNSIIASFHPTVFIYISPYLYPITNTLMTCSSYMTVAVAINRYLDIVGNVSMVNIPRLTNGYLQAFIVLLASSAVNAPRWFEFSCCKYNTEMINVTDKTSGNIIEENVTIAILPIINDIRDKYEYVLYYTVITSNVLTLLLPMILLSISAVLIFREMARTANLTAGLLSDAEETSRRRRYQSVTFMLIGIIILFIFCRVGELLISIYELVMLILNGRRESFPASVRMIIIFNHFLLVCNSSLNFAIYCKDVFFRQCLRKLYHAIRGKKSNGGNFSLQETQLMTRGTHLWIYMWQENEIKFNDSFVNVTYYARVTKW